MKRKVFTSLALCHEKQVSLMVSVLLKYISLSKGLISAFQGFLCQFLENWTSNNSDYIRQVSNWYKNLIFLAFFSKRV